MQAKYEMWAVVTCVLYDSSGSDTEINTREKTFRIYLYVSHAKVVNPENKNTFALIISLCLKYIFVVLYKQA
jgi:hypothetical protein